MLSPQLNIRSSCGIFLKISTQTPRQISRPQLGRGLETDSFKSFQGDSHVQPGVSANGQGDSERVVFAPAEQPHLGTGINADSWAQPLIHKSDIVKWGPAICTDKCSR